MFSSVVWVFILSCFVLLFILSVRGIIFGVGVVVGMFVVSVE